WQKDQTLEMMLSVAMEGAEAIRLIAGRDAEKLGQGLRLARERACRPADKRRARGAFWPTGPRLCARLSRRQGCRRCGYRPSEDAVWFWRRELSWRPAEEL